MRVRPLIACGCLLVALAARADDSFTPYVAYVAQSQATLRSGPGESFYATEKLPRATTVEIYAHENEFAAIRPPKASFSWTPAVQLRLVSAGVAEVIDDEAVSWVGSSLEQPAQPRYQVQLRKGERLQILGEKRIEGGDASVWYKIAPPAGEFRWVRLAELTRDPPEEAAAPTPTGGWTVRSRDKTNATEPGVSRPVLQPAGDASADSEPKTLLPIVANEPFELSLSRIELELSVLATRPSDQWRLDTLKQQVNALEQRAGTTIERAESRRLAEKIADFDELAKRRESLADWKPGRSTGGSSGEQLTADSASSTPSPFAPKFDGQGKLLPVVTSNPKTPRYALMDGDGKLIQYITPAPGLNLHRYLRKQIGVFGQTEFLPNLKAKHLTASRVVVIQ